MIIKRKQAVDKNREIIMIRDLRSSGFLRSEYWQFRTDVSGQPVGSIFKVQESKRKLVSLIRTLYKKECGWRQVVSANRVEACAGMKGSVVVSVDGERRSMVGFYVVGSISFRPDQL